MVRFIHPSKDDISLSGILGALSDPVRVSILKSLLNAEGMSCCQASPCPKIAKSTLSNHFRILREAGLIRMEKHGVENLSVVRLDEINDKFPGLLKTILKHAE
ncbi:MAG: ArsR family transcriptional regulator [Micavibrio aeruginosavorus]|uniref:ArsR family transcriptional regulator n=1 Tax=Micavibrio aeruginosavorus TaxID=349221 RepID=A0A2W5FMN9_9BACT|nr:MAG: ArsR family transcriptional regulator [Micavibrio aeruginosavorus]